MGLRRCEWQRKLRLRWEGHCHCPLAETRRGDSSDFPSCEDFGGHCVPSMPPTLPAASCPRGLFSEELDAGPCSP